MNKIIFPLKVRMKRPEVADLQDALQLLLDRGVILANDERTRPELSAALKAEREKQTYDRATRDLVSTFQSERRLPVTGEVDEATANALNTLLREWGLLDSPTGTATSQAFAVRGRLLNSDGSPGSRAIVKAFDTGLRTETFVGEPTTAADGKDELRKYPEQLRQTS